MPWYPEVLTEIMRREPNERKPWLTRLVAKPASTHLSSRLEWTPARITPARMEMESLRDNWVDLGEFASALREASLFDNRSLGIPGAVIALPLGQQVTRLYWELVRHHYDAAGLQEYDYPFLAPPSYQQEFDKVFPSQDKVLFVGTLKEFEANHPRALLLPTGESLIYNHWARTVRSETDLPIRMYRQARFFRPWAKRSSGIFQRNRGCGYVRVPLLLWSRRSRG